MAHGDYTGNQKAELAIQYAKEQQLKANSLSMVSQVVEGEKKEVIVLFPDKINDPDAVSEVTEFSDEGEVNHEPSDPEFDPVMFRCSESIDDVTFGNGDNNIFQLEMGRTYVAPKCVYDHLEQQGLVWH